VKLDQISHNQASVTRSGPINSENVIETFSALLRMLQECRDKVRLSDGLTVAPLTLLEAVERTVSKMCEADRRSR
jgi:hypothetical protein